MTSVERTSIEEAARHEAELNERQRRVLDLIAAGRTNAEIGATLGITLDGAKWNVSEILTKLGFATREEAADYWRNRRGARLGRALRGLLAIPAVKVAAGVGVAASVTAVAVAVWLASTSGSAVTAPSVPPFVMEARFTVTDFTSSGTGIAIPNESTGTLRAWFREPGRFRWDVDFVSGLNSTTMVLAADGTTQTSYDSGTNTFTREPSQPLPGGYVLPPFGETFVGPLPQRNLTEYLDSLRSPTMQAEAEGQEVMFGRALTTIRLTPTNPLDLRRGLVWVDTERMFLMKRMAGTSGGQFVRMEVTQLSYGLAATKVPIAFAVPGTATDRWADRKGDAFQGGSTTSVGSGAFGDSLTTLSTPPGFLSASYSPNDWVASVIGTSGGSAPDEIVATDAILGGADYLRVQQRKSVLPALLRNDSPTIINNHDTYRGTNGAARTLAWEQDGVAVLLTTNALSYEELERISASMALQP